MKKILLILTALIVSYITPLTVNCENIPINIHRETDPDKNTSFDRAPMRLPIEVIFNADSNTIEVKAPEYLEGEVYIQDSMFNLEAYSPTLNVLLQVSNRGPYTITIKGMGWYATGVIE